MEKLKGVKVWCSRELFSCHLSNLTITPSLNVIRAFSDIPHATRLSLLPTTRDDGRHEYFPICRCVYFSIAPPVNLPDCSGVSTSECRSAFLAVHLYSRLASCRPDQPACQSLHLMACLFDWLAALFHVCLPMCLSMWLLVWRNSLIWP